MNLSSHAMTADIIHTELWFQSLYDPGRGYAFPCDAGGQVNLDELSDNARRNYFLARKLVGHKFATPMVVCQPGCETAMA